MLHCQKYNEKKVELRRSCNVIQLGFKIYLCEKVCSEKLFEMESRSQSRSIYLKQGKKEQDCTNTSFFLSCFPLRAQLFGCWKGVYLKLGQSPVSLSKLSIKFISIYCCF